MPNRVKVDFNARFIEVRLGKRRSWRCFPRSAGETDLDRCRIVGYVSGKEYPARAGLDL